MDKIDYEAKLAKEVQQLRDFQRSLEEEHRNTLAEASDGEPILEASVVYAAAEQQLLKSVAQAADTVVNLLEYADKDATKFAVAKYVLDLARSHNAAGEAEHPFEEILRKIAPKVADEN